jgi:hypothetical protein
MSSPVTVSDVSALEHSQNTKQNLLADNFSVRGIALVFFISVIIVSSAAAMLRLFSDYMQSPPARTATSGEDSGEFILYFSKSETPEVIPPVEITDQDYSIWQEISKQFQIFGLAAAEASTSASMLEPGGSSQVTEKTSPLLRVGLFYTNNYVEFSSSGGYQVLAGDKVVLTSTGESTVKMRYDRVKKTYVYTYGAVEEQYSEPLHIVGLNNSVLTIESYRHPPAWNRSLPDNQFRGKLEIHFATSTGRTWIINELPVEDYLKGLGETRSTDNFEYLKVMTIVGRSYALWHKADNFKHGLEGFDVDAYCDQVYQGYANELRHPELVRAVAETFGEVVTYQGKVAVTPYFARSNGHTKNWSEVWYHDPYPWIVAVEVPQEKGFSQLGHGVGLSAVGAMIMAEQGENYQEVIKHFYKDVEISTLY